MTKLFTLVIVFLGIVAASAQNARERVILWGGDTTCGYRGSAIPSEDKISCESLSTPRGIVSVINHNGISIAASFLEDEDYIIAATFIKNTTAEPFGFDSDLWGAAHFEKKGDFYAGKKPLVAETAIPSRDIVRGMRSGVVLDDSLDVFMAGISKSSEVKEVRRPDGTRVKKVVIVEDPEAQRTAGSRSDSRAEHAQSEQERIRKNALTQKWIGANGAIKGLVYFRRVKKAELVVFSFKILDTTYVFRLSREKS
jgi:hypothetical protein